MSSQPATVSALAEALVMDAGGLAHTLKPLDRDGLIAISVDPKDRRNRLIELTQMGRDKLAESDVLWEAAHRGFESAYGAQQSAFLREAMCRLVSGEFIDVFERSLAQSAQDCA